MQLDAPFSIEDILLAGTRRCIHCSGGGVEKVARPSSSVAHTKSGATPTKLSGVNLHEHRMSFSPTCIPAYLGFPPCHFESVVERSKDVSPIAAVVQQRSRMLACMHIHCIVQCTFPGPAAIPASPGPPCFPIDFPSRKARKDLRWTDSLLMGWDVSVTPDAVSQDCRCPKEAL